jgi:hypothetical protein
MAVTICYPTSGASVPGGGGVFSWGTVSSDDAINGIYVQWQSDGGPVTVNGFPVIAPDPCNWAFEFSDVGVGPTITLTVNANSGTYNVTFKCVGHN